MTERKRTDVCGVLFDCLTANTARERLFSALDGNYPQTALYTPNPEIVMIAEKDESFRDIMNGAELVVADGIGVIKAAAILKTPLPERIPGIELGEAMIKYCASKGEALPVYMLGGKPGVAEDAAKNMQAKYPGLCVCGTHDGYFDMSGGEENDRVISEINEKGAKLVLVCVGAPKQETWIHNNRARMPEVGVFAGLGGSLDVFSGRVKRAPEFFCKMGLEWFYRLMKEPSRIGRMSKLPLFLVHAMKYKKNQ